MTSRTTPAAGLLLVTLGLGTFVLSLLFDGGFLKGFFQGATVALMVLGAWAIAKERRIRGGSWLPSRESDDESQQTP